MSIEKVRDYFKNYNREQDILEFPVSSATVDLAAKAVGVEMARIAKTLSFYEKDKEHAFLVVTAGDQKIDNKNFRHTFGLKAKMLSYDDALRLTGHAVGGVCPFANPKDVTTYLDVSLKRFETVFPAAGSSNSAIQLTCEELEQYSNAKEWVDVCKPIETL